MSVDLRHGNVKGLIFKLAVPAMLAQFVNVLYNIVDRIFISNIPVVGGDALGGIGICAPILTVITGFTYLSALGGGPLMAMALGAREEKEAQDIFSTCIGFLFIIAACLTGFFVGFLDPLLKLFGATKELLPYAHDYLLIYASGAAIGILALGLNTFVSAQGFSKHAMLSVACGALTNIVFDYVFIYPLGLGVQGAAYATLLGQFVTLLYCVIFFLGKQTQIRIRCKFDFKRMGKIAKLGFSPFIICSTDGVIIIILNAALKKFGGADANMYITAATIAAATFQIVAMPMAGISSGCQPLLSYNLGAKQYARVKKAFKYDMLFCFTFCCSMFIIFQSIPGQFAKIFTNDPAMIEMSIRCIRIYTFGFLILGFQYAGVDGLTALGLPKPALFLSLNRKVVCFLATMILPMIFGAEAAFYSEPVADIYGSVISLFVTVYTVKKLLERNGYIEESKKKFS